MNTLLKTVKEPFIAPTASFKTSFPFEKRKDESDRIREKYPDKIPVIVERAYGSSVHEIDKKKYLVPIDLTMGQFIYIVRRRINLPAEQALFLFLGNSIAPTSALMGTTYEKKKDADGFLYITYAGENTFGSYPIITSAVRK